MRVEDVADVPGLDPQAHLRVTRREHPGGGGIVTISMTRPAKHNAQGPTTWYGLAAIGRRLVAATARRMPGPDQTTARATEPRPAATGEDGQ